jgi:DNA-binding IclR family transcriptional regulator
MTIFRLRQPPGFACRRISLCCRRACSAASSVREPPHNLSALFASLTTNNLAQKLAQASSPHVQELSREFRETVSVAFAFENQIEVCLPSPQKIQMGNIVGSIIPPHASSLGKSILANLPEQRRERLLRTYGINRLTEQTIVDEVELSREFAAVRARGYATDLEESTLEGCCFGAPILDGAGYAIGAVSVSSPKMRCVHPEKLLPALRGAAEAISRAMQLRSDSFRR